MNGILSPRVGMELAVGSQHWVGVLGDIFGWYLGRGCVGAMLLGAVSVSSSRAGCCDFHTQLPTVAWLAMRRETELNVVQSLRLNTEEEKKGQVWVGSLQDSPRLVQNSGFWSVRERAPGGSSGSRAPGLLPSLPAGAGSSRLAFPRGKAGCSLAGSSALADKRRTPPISAPNARKRR